MKFFPYKNIYPILFSFLSGTLLFLAFPLFNQWYLAFIGFVPLFFAIQNKSLKQSFFLSYLSGLIFFFGLMYWLGKVSVSKLILLVLYLGLYFGVFGIILCGLGISERLQKLKTNLCALFLIPSIWVGLEFIRSHAFSGFGWGLLGYSQYKNLYFIQIADISSIYGVSFLVMLVNVAIFLCIIHIKENKLNIKQLLTIIILPLLFIALIYTYGTFRINQNFGEKNLKVSIIQGNIPQNKKWKSKYREWIVNRHLRLTIAASKDNPDLIVWPEASFPGRFDRDIDLRNKVLTWVRHLETPLLIGAIVRARRKGVDPYNTAILISSKGKVIKRYDKLKLVPFSEYVIFSKKFPVLRKLAVSGNLTPGKEYTVFKLNKNWPFSVLICYEVIFEDLVRNFVKNGANFIINISNDAWYRYSPASFQQLQALVFRAIENRKSAIRAGNIGISCFISPKGKIYGKVEDRKGNKLQITGYSTENIKIMDIVTFYNKYGNLFVYICIVISIVGIIKRSIKVTF